MSTLMIKIEAHEKDNKQSVTISLTKLDADGREIPANWSEAIGVMERAKLQVLGQSFTEGALQRFDLKTEAHKALLKTATGALNAATDLNARLLEAGVFDALKKQKAKRRTK